VQAGIRRRPAVGSASRGGGDLAMEGRRRAAKQSRLVMEEAVVASIRLFARRFRQIGVGGVQRCSALAGAAALCSVGGALLRDAKASRGTRPRVLACHRGAAPSVHAQAGYCGGS
jgi:hypothetical protein